MKGKIILTFDLEFWYDTQFLKKYLPPPPREDYLIESVEPVLELLRKYNAGATFFTTGEVMEKYPALINQIYSEGHEISCHGYSHKPLGELGREKFAADIRRFVELQTRTIGQKPRGFRAPCLSLVKETDWALPVLAELGFKYHSGRTALANSPLKELPVGFSGGVYFRLLPLFLFKKILKRQGIIYLHPHELLKEAPVIEKAPFFKKFLKYYKVKDSRARLEKLLKSYPFCSVERALN